MDDRQDRQILATNNMCLVQQEYGQEWKYNRGSTNELPQLGLSLSGGGMRSGTFCIGVLHGLFDLHVLDNVDVISSVSGGGYALSWLYTQSFYSGFDEKAIFDDDGKYQKYLITHGELVSHYVAKQKYLRDSEYTYKFLENATSIPYNLLANGLFGWHANSVPSRRTYEDAIDRVFDVVPNEEGKRSELDFTSFRDCSIFLNPPKHITFEQLASADFRGKLPFPVINTTAHIDDSPAEDVGLLQNRVFEFTPLHYGCDYFGFNSNNFPVDFNKAISISGAAADAKLIREPNESELASVLNYDLGYSINNPDVKKSTIILSDMWPFPFYLFDGHYGRDYNGTRIYLSDGGHCENLGAYSLVRRLCKTIIMVDAGCDPKYSFDDYHTLKRALQYEMGVNFSVSDIDSGSFNRTGRTNPVMMGTISYFPLAKTNENVMNKFTIDVIYIKLSIDTNKLTSVYPEPISDYYHRTRGHDVWCQLSEFPHEITFDLSYYPEQVAAYHKLGRYIVTNNPAFFENVISHH